MTEYRLVVKIHADAPGARAAALLVKQLLEPLYGRVGTITIVEWLAAEHDKRAEAA